MSKQIRIAQISDLHIKGQGQLAYGRVDTAKALERCVVTLNALNPAPDFVVISGDLADTPTKQYKSAICLTILPSAADAYRISGVRVSPKIEWEEACPC